MEITTVGDDFAVLHDGLSVQRFDGLEPDTTYDLAGFTVRTLPRPPGELLTRFATVNDVHFGEEECGRLGDSPLGPIRRAAPGEDPYPEVMNRGAVAEIDAAGVDAVVVKGDLSGSGLAHEWAAFEACYRGRFGDRLHAVRGNHDSYAGQDEYADDLAIHLTGITIALLDTAIPTETTGKFTADQAAWLHDVAADAGRDGRAVMVMGHHQNWIGGKRADDYFGIHPDDSERLAEVIAAQRAIVAYTAGHTHRHRVRTSGATGAVPYVEVGCVKDFPGTWAEYRVYEGGIQQIVHRVSTPEALAWSEGCRHLYSEFGIDYETYALGSLAERCFTISLRP